MIELQLSDGRTLSFDHAPAAPVSVGLPSVTELSVAEVRTEDLSGSSISHAGPDFFLSRAGEPDAVLAVELKKVSHSAARNPDQWQQSLAKIQRSMRTSKGVAVPLQLWILGKDGRTLQTWQVGEQGLLHGEQTYELTQVTNRKVDEFDVALSGEQSVTTDHLVRRVNDWEGRIRALYDAVGNWSSAEGGGLKVNRSNTIIMHEEMMRRFAVPPRELPVLKVLSGEEVVLTFKPYGLWIIGANGRIDLFGKHDTFFLLDKARQFSAPEWVLYGKSPNRFKNRLLATGVAFDEGVFRELISA